MMLFCIMTGFGTFTILHLLMQQMKYSENFFPYLAIRPKAEWQDRLYCFVHAHKKYKRGLAENRKIGVCEMAHKKSFPTLRATIQVLLT